MSLQIKGKFIRLENGESLKILDSSGSEVSLIGLNGSDKVVVKGQEVAIKSEVAADLTSITGAFQSAIQGEADARAIADTALQGEVNAVEADLAQEILDRQSGDTNTLASANEYTDTEVASLQSQINTLTGGTSGISLTTLDGRLDILEGGVTVEGSVAKAEQDAKDYADQQIAALVDSAPALLDTLNELAAALGDDPNFAASITATITNGDAATLVSAKGYTDTKVAVVQGEVDAVELALSSEITRATNAEIALDGRLDVIEGSGVGSIAKAQLDAQAYADAAVLVEKTRAELAEAGLVGRLDVIEGSGEGSVAKAESDAKAHADAAVAAEAVLRDAADVALDGRLDVLEARAHYKKEFVLTSTDISNGYVDLMHKAMAKSIVASVGRLMIHEGASYDFTVEDAPSGLVTRITFVNSLVTVGQEKLSAGDVVFVKYMA
jgi:hypothetical protein